MSAAAASPGGRTGPWVIASVAVIVAAALAVWLMGHPWICECGTVKLWHGDVVSSENSQHLTDWYTWTHIVHGLVFYFALWLVVRAWPGRVRFLIALLIESGWEVIENTPWIINRYRETTISLDYFGDSVINVVTDILAMIVGYFIAARAPVWVSVLVLLAIEGALAFAIRDNLTLNVLMLIYPLDAIRDWQAGG